MNKGLKLLAKIAMTCCLVGVLLCLVGWAWGADIGAVLNSDTLDIEWNDDFIDIDVHDDSMEIRESMKDWNGTSTIQTTSPSKEMVFDGFTDIIAQLAVTELRVEPGEDYSMTIVEGAGKSFSYKVENSTLLLKEEESKPIHDTESSQIVITVPEDAYLGEIEIQQGVGEIVIRDLTFRELDISAGIGNTELEHLSVESLTIEGGMGNIKGRNLKVSKELDLDNGVGTVDLAGDFCGEIELDNGVGKMEISFERSQKNYYVEIENGLGDLTIHGDGAIGGKSSVNQIAGSNGIGSMTLNFYE